MKLSVSRIAQHQAQRAPERACVTCDGVSVTWSEFDAVTNQLARVYWGMGVREGDLVTIALPNGVGLYQAVFATWKCGATPNPLSTRMPTPEAQAILDVASPALLVGGAEDLRALRRLPADFVPDAGISSAALPERTPRYWKAIASGGSTGRPKIIVSHEEGAFDPDVTILGQSRDGVVLNAGPLYNNGPFKTSMAALFSGNQIITMPRFSDEDVCALIERYRVDWMFLVPTMMNRIARVLREKPSAYDISSLRHIFHSASMCPAWLKQEWIDLLGPEGVLESYGGTEGYGSTTITGREWLERKGSVGRAAPGCDVVILDENGDELPCGAIGEIFFRRPKGASTTFHYLGAEVRAMNDAVSVGDLGHLDEEGYLYISDRRTDMIVTGGANVYPAEVESALDAHPDILSSIVIGLPDQDMVARVHAIVQPADASRPPSDEAVREFLKTRIAGFKIPRSFEFVSHTLRDDAGKARRTQLRDERLNPA